MFNNIAFLALFVFCMLVLLQVPAILHFSFPRLVHIFAIYTQLGLKFRLYTNYRHPENKVAVSCCFIDVLCFSYQSYWSLLVVLA